MGITNSNKELNTNHIDCGDSFKVTLSLTAEPDIVNNPTDIVLILDRSRSMAGSPLANLKNGAKKFIDIIDEATDSTKDGQIGFGSRIGIVSFADTARQDTQLITSAASNSCFRGIWMSPVPRIPSAIRETSRQDLLPTTLTTSSTAAILSINASAPQC